MTEKNNIVQTAVKKINPLLIYFKHLAKLKKNSLKNYSPNVIVKTEGVLSSTFSYSLDRHLFFQNGSIYEFVVSKGAILENSSSHPSLNNSNLQGN